MKPYPNPPAQQTRTRPATSPLRWFGRVLVYTLLLAYFVLGVGYLALRYHVWPNLESWRPQITEQIGLALGRSISIGEIATDFDGFAPLLQVKSLRVHGEGGLVVPAAQAVVSLRTFLTGQLRLTKLELRSPQFEVRRNSAGQWIVAGWPVSNSNDSHWFDRFLAQQRLVVHDARIAWIDERLSRSQTLAGVNLEIKNFGRRHSIELQAERLGNLAQNFEISAELFRAPGVASNTWQQWHGNVYAAADHVVADILADAFAVVLPFSAATGEVRLWSRLEDARLNDIQLKLAGQSMQIDLGEAKPILIERFGGDASAVRRADGGIDWVVRRLSAQTDSGFVLRSLGPQTVALDPLGQFRSAQFSFDDLDVAGALAIAKRLPLPARLQRVLLPIKSRGRVNGMQGRIDRRETLEYDTSFKFSQLSLLMPGDAGVDVAAIDAGNGPGARPPSVENVSGIARIRHDGGRIELDGTNSTLVFPGLFEKPRIALDTLDAKFNWHWVGTAGATALKVVIEQASFANADAAGELQGSYQTAASGLGIADLRGNFNRADATKVARYLPLRYVSAPVRHWVRDAVAGGAISQAQFKLRGSLQAFPFRNPGDGEFLIEAQIQEGQLSYAPGWPGIDQMAGQLRFAAAGMDLQLNKAQCSGVNLSETRASIGDFQSALLNVEGQARGAAQELLRFVNESPVLGYLDGFTREIKVGGDAGLQLKLELPLDGLKNSRVKGVVLLERNDVLLDASIPVFEQVSGKLQFSQESFGFNGLSGTFLGGALQVDGQTQEPGRFSLKARGQMSAQNIRNLALNPLTEKLTGQAQYRASLEVFQKNAKLAIESDLQGLASELPEPFYKPADAIWPLQVTVTPSSGSLGAAALPNSDFIDVTLNQKAKLQLARQRDPNTNKLLIERAAFGYDAPAIMRAPGFSVNVNRAQLNLDRWLDLLSAPSTQNAGDAARGEFAPGFSLLPNFVSVVSEQVTIAGKPLHDVVFGASRLGGFWRANVNARELDGYFNWSEARHDQRIGALKARFSRLEIPQAKRGDIETLIESVPQELPSLDIDVDELVLADRSLGKLSLQAASGGTKDEPSWFINSLRVENPGAVLQASGVWAPPRGPEARKTQLDYRLEVFDAGELLNRLGMKDVMKDGAGALSGQLLWNGSPFSMHYPSLAGNTMVKLAKGQFLKTEPGLAKLIGVLNLQFLPRRLTLDFDDVFAAGFSFDEIEGKAQIEQGMARTEALQMTGVQARVRLKGEVDLAQETQRLEVEVKPELNAGLASLAYAALANPAVGLTTFLAQTLLRRPLEEIFTYQYDVSGTWADPQVAQRRRELIAPSPHLP